MLYVLQYRMKKISRSEAIKLDQEFYFTGKPCKHGHVDLRFTKSRICRTCRSEYRSRYYFANREKQSQQNKEWRLRNKDKRKQYMREWRDRNRERIDEYTKRYQEENRESYRLNERRRRARKLNADGYHTVEDIEKIIKAQNFLCAGCRCDVTNSYDIDHIYPISKGGSDWPENLQILCKSCNRIKSDCTDDSWRNFI